MSYLMFWPTFSTAGSARIGRRAASVAASSSTSRPGRPAHRQVIGLARLPARTTARPGRPGAGRSRSSRCRRRTAAAGSARRGTSRTPRAYRPRDSRPPRSAPARAARPRLRRPARRGTGGTRTRCRAPSGPRRRAAGSCSASQSSASGRSSRSVTSCAGPPGGLGVLAQALLLLRALDPVDVRQELVERAELLEKRGGDSLRRCRARPGRCRPSRRSGPGSRRPGRGGCPIPSRGPAASITLFLRRLRMRIWSLINWRASLSAVTMKTSSPRSSPRRARVAITSSASIPGSIEHRDAKALEHPADHRDLRDQVDGHLLAVRLVLGVDAPSETPARRRRRPPPGSRACGPCTRLSRSRKIPKTACVGCPAGPVISGIAWKT